jgi:hypothetical protein
MYPSDLKIYGIYTLKSVTDVTVCNITCNVVVADEKVFDIAMKTVVAVRFNFIFNERWSLIEKSS